MCSYEQGPCWSPEAEDHRLKYREQNSGNSEQMGGERAAGLLHVQ